MDFEWLKNTQRGKCVVMGCGPSVTTLQPYVDKCFKIGVNDVGDFCDPDMLVILDYKDVFAPKRYDTIISTRPKMLASQVPQWDKDIASPHHFFQLRLGSRKIENFDTDLASGKVPISITSPYVGIALAYYMGFDEIGLTGVDFTQNHYNNNDGIHKLNKRIEEVNTAYKNIYNKLKEHDVLLWNLSKESVIGIPKMDLKEFFSR